MTTTPNMGLDLPVDHDTNETWGDKLNRVFGSSGGGIDAHNHTVGQGVKVPTGGMNIDADLSFSPTGTPRALLDLKAVDFSAVAASVVTGLSGALFVDSANNELTWRNTLGTNVQLTAGSSLNVASLAGGIGGDYSVVGALESFDDASDSYLFQQQGAPRPWARIRTGDVDIFETAASIVNRVRLQSPAALAASYAVKWFTALPASKSIVSIDNTGALAADATGLSATTFTGAVTLNAGATAAVNQHVAISGTGLFKHGTKTLSIHGSAFHGSPIAGNTNTYNTAAGFTFTDSTGVDGVYAAIELPVGARILAVRVFVQDNATGTTKLTASLLSLTSAAVSTVVASSAQSAGNGTNQTLTVSPAATTIAASTGYAIRVTQNLNNACSVRTAEVDYDQP